MLELLVLVALVLLGEFIPSDDDDVDNRVYVTLVLVLLVVVALVMMARLFVCLFVNVLVIRISCKSCKSLSCWNLES